MIGYIIRRIFQTIPLLFAIVTIIFFALRMLPADPAMARNPVNNNPPLASEKSR